jgi:hypothetical protein
MRVFSMAWLLVGVLLAGCTARVTAPEIEIEAGGPVRIEVDGRQPGFCPPGQRKKGNC